MYLNYKDYLDMGGHEEEGVFWLAIGRASGIMDKITHGRLRKFTVDNMPERVKIALMQAVELLSLDIASSRDGRVQRMKNEGLEVQFFSEKTQSLTSRIESIMRDTLQGVLSADGKLSLIYAGVDE